MKYPKQKKNQVEKVIDDKKFLKKVNIDYATFVIFVVFYHTQISFSYYFVYNYLDWNILFPAEIESLSIIT